MSAIERRTDAYTLFGDSLLGVLVGRNLIDMSSASFLANIPGSMASSGKSKYYTREEREKLKSILPKRIEETTWDDVRELKRIIGLIEREIYEVGNIELTDTLVKVKFITAMHKGYLFVKTHGKRD